MAEARESALARIALAAMVKQANAAMGAEVDFSVLEVYRALTAWANAFGQALQRNVITQLFAAL